MKRTIYTAEQIIRILREAETSGENVEAFCLKHNISKSSFQRWKKKYGGMGLAEAQRLRELEKENRELKAMLADELLRSRALKIALEKNY
jgi:putative transposase